MERPRLAKSAQRALLVQLSGETLADLVRLWSRMPGMRPEKKTPAEITVLLDQIGTSKIRLVNSILSELYPKGLNATQLAQIDVQRLMDRPNSVVWCNATNEQGIIQFDPQTLLNEFISKMRKLYMCHVYIARHNQYPMYILRIQIYDYQPTRTAAKRSSVVTKEEFEAHFEQFKKSRGPQQKAKPRMYLNKPMYVLIPLSTPNVIYSAVSPSEFSPSGHTRDINHLSTKLTIQNLEVCLGARLKHDTQRLPIKTLKGLFLLKGNSRFGNCLGGWMAYADDSVDGQILGDGNDNFRLSSARFIDSTLSMRDNMVNLRFRGVNKIKSKLMYDNVDETAEQDDHEDAIQISQFTKELSSGIKMQFVGMDTLGGLAELARRRVIDIESCPDWVTGEELTF